ncbi:flagellar biosynthesis protein FlhB [Capillimicrobium parvum]|uniref:Flagellar biosynthetic protein FlhB n=1 Tax=Capillimicrobium parvum TaxID=2884022 RepID=A0A9E6XRZ1_9ACTN|nr:flagellar biosynthesis protein FlhB [Capillimicrobium parvum]UGS33744.1 Flagellar biosynthetic protein FlhB [Capillimicrobium parvum]
MADKTEKATPKRRDEARRKGQVARSADLGGAAVLLAGLLALGATGPAIAAHLADVMTSTLQLTAHPEVVSERGLPSVLLAICKHVGSALAPLVGACVAAAIVVNVVMVRPRPSMAGLKPDPKRLNPIKGVKNIYGPQAAFELGKSLTKLTVVGAIVAAALVPQLTELGAMVGMEPGELAGAMASSIFSMAKRAAIAYLVIGVIDFVWQRHRTDKSMRMDKQEVKDEAKQQQLPAEVRGAMRRRQMAASRARMMTDVPTADVVVTNPTHYAVALRYDGSNPAPEVVAKGVDLVAARIRAIASEHGVAIVPDPPLARTLHASVEVGHQIPEELFGAVAQLLAFVYRTRKVLTTR